MTAALRIVKAVGVAGLMSALVLIAPVSGPHRVSSVVAVIPVATIACSTAVAPSLGLPKNPCRPCGPHGKCTAKGCKCDVGWMGVNCNQKFQANVTKSP
jgi:hypothetical protein